MRLARSSATSTRPVRGLSSRSSTLPIPSPMVWRRWLATTVLGLHRQDRHRRYPDAVPAAPAAFSEGLCTVMIDERLTGGKLQNEYIDKTGTVVIGPFEWSTSFSEGLAAVGLRGKRCREVGLHGHDRHHGHPAAVRLVRDFSEALAAVGFPANNDAANGATSRACRVVCVIDSPDLSCAVISRKTPRLSAPFQSEERTRSAMAYPIVHGNVYRGFESPLSALESQERQLTTRPRGRVLASFRRVRGQVGGKLNCSRIRPGARSAPLHGRGLGLVHPHDEHSCLSSRDGA